MYSLIIPWLSLILISLVFCIDCIGVFWMVCHKSLCRRGGCRSIEGCGGGSL